MDKTCSFILWFVFFPLLITGQDLDYLPQLLPSSYTVYDIERGLPSNCTEKTFLDPLGRLWLNQCLREGLLKAQGFFMYDGNKHYEIQMHDTTGAALKYIYQIDGITQAGILYGKDETKTKCFLLNTTTRQQQFFSFGKEETIAYLVEGDNGQLFVLTQNEEGWFVYELKAGTKRLLAKTAYHKGSKRLDLENISGAVKIGSTIWFVNNQEGFVKFDIRQRVFEKYFWRDYFGTGFSLTFDDGNQTRLVDISADNQGNLLFFLRKKRDFSISMLLPRC